jgi:hypothetical protein
MRIWVVAVALYFNGSMGSAKSQMDNIKKKKMILIFYLVISHHPSAATNLTSRQQITIAMPTPFVVYLGVIIPYL